eukprot:788125-Pelagomonas_calceolata.AAC.2
MESTLPKKRCRAKLPWNKYPYCAPGTCQVGRRGMVLQDAASAEAGDTNGQPPCEPVRTGAEGALPC